MWALRAPLKVRIEEISMLKLDWSKLKVKIIGFHI